MESAVSSKALAWLALAVAACLAGCMAQTRSGNPATRFTCQGRPSGYYADIDTGCQVYHMCDGMGRQFTYTCPNTTLFQQRMLVCDHWYMVNCSKAESDYGANLLIGQRDKPFVSDHEMALRTPRPDILTVPYNHNYYDGLKQAETKYHPHPGNSIVTDHSTAPTGGDTNSGLDSGKSQYTPQFTSSTTRPPNIIQNPGTDHNTQESTIKTQFTSSTIRPTTVNGGASDEFELDIRMHSEEERPTTDAVVTFIKRFDPNSPATPPGTAMTTSEILDINRQLPAASHGEDSRRGSRRKSVGAPDTFNALPASTDKGRPTPSSVFRAANTKPPSDEAFRGASPGDRPPAGIAVPDRVLRPPKTAYPNLPSTTMGPPIYYEWKWAVPAFDLEPPKEGNATRIPSDPAPQAPESGRPSFRNVTTRSPTTPRSVVATAVPEYHPSSYFVPDYIFPLDNPHPGYQERGAQTSFQVSVPEKGRSYGENPACPQCHPAYLTPGTCEPCVVQR